MSLVSLLAFSGAMLLLAVTPGPGVFAVVARAMASGFKHSAVLTIGIIMGDLVFLLMAIYGLTAVARNLSGLFLVIRYLGAAYLIYLGMNLWRRKAAAMPYQDVRNFSFRSDLMTGLLITLGNPKVILFYLGFLPTFVDVTALTGKDVCTVASLVTLVLGSTMLAYGYVAASLSRRFQCTKFQQVMHRSSGGVMIATGVVLAAKT